MALFVKVLFLMVEKLNRLIAMSRSLKLRTEIMHVVILLFSMDWLLSTKIVVTYTI